MTCNAGLSDQEYLYVPRLTLAHLGVQGVPANSDGKLLPMDQNPDGHCLSYTKSMLDCLLMCLYSADCIWKSYCKLF